MKLLAVVICVLFLGCGGKSTDHVHPDRGACYPTGCSTGGPDHR